MPVNANTIFHVTKSFESLKSILENGFEVNYCYETLTHNWKKTDGHDKNVGVWIPMISFSDIPLSMINSHFIKYKSSYAIGMSKKWALDNGINPVLYTQSNAELSEQIIDFLHDFKKTGDNQLKNTLAYILSYTKNYKGVFKKDCVDTDNLPYDEREWRYVPNNDDIKDAEIDRYFENILGGADNKGEISEDIKKKIREIKLNVNISELNYLIVKQKSDIKQLIDFIIDKFPKQSDKLITKIFTLHQINNDF